jgi:D-beta-D-heptose 7-phosphate kinase/D-beta-D-heptose 1-phosphate adenosyltransferase
MSFVLISDYDKGSCDPSVCVRVINECRTAGIPVIVDPPRGQPWQKYFGATGIKCNRVEAERELGVSLTSSDSFCMALDRIMVAYSPDWAIITAGPTGMYVMERSGRFWRQPTAAYDPVDVTGAGDAVMATLGFLIGHSVQLDTAVRMAAAAGTLSTRQLGALPIPIAAIRELANDPCMVSRKSG